MSVRRHIVLCAGAVVCRKGLNSFGSQDLFRCCREKAFPVDSTIMTRGEPGLEMYFILEGEMGVYLDLDAPAVAELTPGDIVGEGALVNDEPRKAHIVAQEDSRVLVLAKADLNTMVSRYPALGKELLVFAEDRKQALAATAGAKMERFVQAREDEKRQMMQKVRSLAGRLTVGWVVVAWGIVLVLWKRIICGIIDGDRTAVDGSGSGSLGEIETALHTPCSDAAWLAYQFMRIFTTVGPALFAVSDWDVDAAARLNPRKCRVGMLVYTFSVRPKHILTVIKISCPEAVATDSRLVHADVGSSASHPYSPDELGLIRRDRPLRLLHSILGPNHSTR